MKNYTFQNLGHVLRFPQFTEIILVQLHFKPDYVNDVLVDDHLIVLVVVHLVGFFRLQHVSCRSETIKICKTNMLKVGFSNTFGGWSKRKIRLDFHLGRK
jgi:hypothetical protein